MARFRSRSRIARSRRRRFACAARAGWRRGRQGAQRASRESDDRLGERRLWVSAIKGQDIYLIVVSLSPPLLLSARKCHRQQSPATTKTPTKRAPRSSCFIAERPAGGELRLAAATLKRPARRRSRRSRATVAQCWLIQCCCSSFLLNFGRAQLWSRRRRRRGSQTRIEIAGPEMGQKSERPDGWARAISSETISLLNILSSLRGRPFCRLASRTERGKSGSSWWRRRPRR